MQNFRPLLPTPYMERSAMLEPQDDGLGTVRGLIWAVIIMTVFGVFMGFLVWGLRPLGRALASLFGV